VVHRIYCDDVLTALRARDIFTKAEVKISQSQMTAFPAFSAVRRNRKCTARAGLVERAENCGGVGRDFESTLLRARGRPKKSHSTGTNDTKVLGHLFFVGLLFLRQWGRDTDSTDRSASKQRGQLEDTLVVWVAFWAYDLLSRANSPTINPVHVH